AAQNYFALAHHQDARHTFVTLLDKGFCCRPCLNSTDSMRLAQKFASADLCLESTGDFLLPFSSPILPSFFPRHRELYHRTLPPARPCSIRLPSQGHRCARAKRRPGKRDEGSRFQPTCFSSTTRTSRSNRSARHSNQPMPWALGVCPKLPLELLSPNRRRARTDCYWPSKPVNHLTLPCQ